MTTNASRSARNLTAGMLGFILGASLAYSANAATLGPELVEHGGFDTEDGWNIGYGWGISPGAAPAQGLAFHNEGSASTIWRPLPANTGTAGSKAARCKCCSGAPS